MGCSLWSQKELDMTEHLSSSSIFFCYSSEIFISNNISSDFFDLLISTLSDV